MSIRFSFRRSVDQVDFAEGTLLHKKLSFAATEAYKLLRTNLMFTLPDEKQCRVIGVTSSIRGEGKSTTAINLSFALAQTGKRVLVVDSDLRLPSVAKKLEVNRTPGLSNLLVGISSEEHSIKQSGVLPNWSILPAGDIPPNPTELIASSRMKGVFESLKQHYDFIIVDLPPVNIVSDALVASHILDGMIVVVRENYSTRRMLNNCTRLLSLSNVKVLGFVTTVAGDVDIMYRKYKRNRYYKNYRGYEKSSATPRKEGSDNK